MLNLSRVVIPDSFVELIRLQPEPLTQFRINEQRQSIDAPLALIVRRNLIMLDKRVLYSPIRSLFYISRIAL
jgi:hypothetical protein